MKLCSQGDYIIENESYFDRTKISLHLLLMAKTKEGGNSRTPTN